MEILVNKTKKELKNGALEINALVLEDLVSEAGENFEMLKEMQSAISNNTMTDLQHLALKEYINS